jgi:hypothetical protein
VIVAATNPFTQAIRAANGAIPIVLIGGDVIEAGVATSLEAPRWDAGPREAMGRAARKWQLRRCM